MVMASKDVKEYELLAKRLRLEIIETSYATGKKGVHLGPALSVADILAVLYGGVMKIDPNNPLDANRDRFILGKGHAYAALYSILSLKGYFSHDTLVSNFMTDGGFLPAHPIKNLEMGIECSSGSLGMGLSYAIGKAINAKRKQLDYQTYVILGDGECDEGSVWEAFIAAVQFKLDNLVVFIDHNHLQHDGDTKDVMNIDFEPVLTALGWRLAVVNGNNVSELLQVLESRDKQSGKPFAIIAETVKGKGISFMEGDNNWHHASLTEEQYQQAIAELQ